MKLVGSLKARLGLDKSKYDKGLKGAKSGAKKFGSAVKKIGAIIGAAFAIKIIARWGKAALNAYREQRSAELKLATIMRDRMKLGEEAFRRIVKQTGEYQKQGVIGDEIQLAGAQQLATFVKQEKALSNLIPAMNNLLAQQKGYNAQAGDAVNIANMMGRVLTGQVSALSRVGISFSDVQEKILKTGNELEVTATLSEVIADNVGNMNQELAKTDLGKIQSWNMFWGDMKEKLGKAIVPYLADIATWAKKSVPKITDAIVDIINMFIEWRNKNVAIRLSHKITFAYIRTGLLQIQIAWEKLTSAIAFLQGAMVLASKAKFGKIGDLWKVTQDDISENTKENKEKIVDIWTELVEDVKKQDKKWKKVGKSHGDAYVEGVGDAKVKPTRGIVAPTPVAGKAITTPLGTFDPASMDGVIEKNKELARWMGVVAEKAQELPVIGGLFEGMANSITSALDSTENVFDAFLKFFGEFIKGMIIKLVAAAIAALALVVILSALGVAKVPKFSDVFTAFSGMKFGGESMAEGGVVPPGYPGDNYPALLSSGERVTPPEKLPISSNSNRLGNQNVKFIIEKDQLVGVLEMYNNQKNNF